jgi:hypothetical protein
MLARLFAAVGGGRDGRVLQTFKPLRNFSRRQRKTPRPDDMIVRVDAMGGDFGETLLEETFRLHDSASCVLGLVIEECVHHASCVHGCGAGPKFEFLHSEAGGRAPLALPAIAYFENVFKASGDVLDGLSALDSLPPTPQLVKALTVPWRRLLRVFSHVWAVHWDAIEALGAQAAVLTEIRHIVGIIKAHGDDLVSSCELEPLAGALRAATT